MAPAGSKPPTIGALALLIAACLPLFFVGLGALGLSEPDEPYYALPALEMVRSGNLAITTFGGEPWFDKPILFYWVVAAGYATLGVSEGASRVGSALAALAGVLAIYLHARRARPRAALLSALALATMLEYAIVARLAITDMTLTLFVTLGMLASARYLSSGRLRAAALAGASFGLAALTKGPVGLLLPAVALAAYAVLARRRDLMRPAAIGACALGALATAGPWYGTMLLRHPDLLLGSFLGHGNLGRLVRPEHPSFPLYYLAILVVGALPWTGALPAAIASAASRPGRAAERGAGRAPGPLFALCWLGAVLAVFSVVASKLPSYLLPALPAAALLIGGFWTDSLSGAREGGPARAARLSAWAGVAIAALVAVALVVAPRDDEWGPAARFAPLASAALVLGALAALVAVRRRSLRGLAIANAAVSISIVLLLVYAAMPALERLDSMRPFARALRDRGAAGSVEGVFGVRERFGLDFYLDRSLPRLDDERALAERVRAAPGGVWIVWERDAERVLSLPGVAGETVYSDGDLAAVRLEPLEPAR